MASMTVLLYLLEVTQFWSISRSHCWDVLDLNVEPQGFGVRFYLKNFVKNPQFYSSQSLGKHSEFLVCCYPVKMCFILSVYG